MTWIDEPHEIAAWTLLVLTPVGVAFDRLADWPAVAVVFLALLVLAGSRRLDGLSLGVGPLEIDVDTGGDD